MKAKPTIPAPMKQAIERLSLPQILLLQGILLDQALKLIGLQKPVESKVIIPDVESVS